MKNLLQKSNGGLVGIYEMLYSVILTKHLNRVNSPEMVFFVYVLFLPWLVSSLSAREENLVEVSINKSFEGNMVI